MDIDVKIHGGGYPCWIDIRVGQNDVIQIDHRELFALEMAVAMAKRDVLASLPRDRWHEVDPALAGK